MGSFPKIIASIKIVLIPLFGKTVFWAQLMAAFLLGYDINFFLCNTGQGDLIYNIMVEAHGLLFDLILFGWIISNYEANRQKNEKVKEDNRQKNERIEKDEDLIEDLRGWKNKEGVRRTAGAIRRLNKEGKTDIKLDHCVLVRARLKNADLTGADLAGANLAGASLAGANLTEACLVRAHLVRAYLVSTDLAGANLTWANLEGAFLMRANLEGAKLVGAKLVGVAVEKDWFEKLEKWKVIGRESIIEDYRRDEQGRLELK